ncbi:lipase, partial [Nocardia cyriacigeorgica]|nr:lipase [Nocardia cyriacigeorgica]
MRRSTSRRLSRVAVVASAAVLALGPLGGQAAAAPTEQELADYIAAGRSVAGPVADSGSSSGSACDSGSGAGSGNGSGDCYGGSGSSSGFSGGYASDTIGVGPAQTSWLAAFAYGLANGDAAPPGANDWNCKPTRETRAAAGPAV